MKANLSFVAYMFISIMFFISSDALSAQKPSQKTINLRMGETEKIHPVSDVGFNKTNNKVQVAESSFGTTDESVAFAIFHSEGDPTYGAHNGEVYYEITPLKVGTTLMTVKVLNNATSK